jgi:hypothetical protein
VDDVAGPSVASLVAVVSPVDALLAAYPGRFTASSAQRWLAARRALLVERAGATREIGLSVSSGCAATGAQAHARGLAEDAQHALLRLAAGLGTECEQCSAILPFERVENAPAAVRCTGCARAYSVDTRWCR